MVVEIMCALQYNIYIADVQAVLGILTRGRVQPDMGWGEYNAPFGLQYR
jgi:hypothetical protein